MASKSQITTSLCSYVLILSLHVCILCFRTGWFVFKCCGLFHGYFMANLSLFHMFTVAIFQVRNNNMFILVLRVSSVFFIHVQLIIKQHVACFIPTFCILCCLFLIFIFINLIFSDVAYMEFMSEEDGFIYIYNVSCMCTQLINPPTQASSCALNCFNMIDKLAV